MNILNIHKPIVFILIGLLSIFYSCEKTQEETTGQGQALVNVKIEGFVYEEQNEIIASTKPIAEENISNTHIQYMSEDFRIESELVAVEDSRATNLTSGLKQASSTVLEELNKNIKYKLLVYNKDGILVTHRDYVYGSETLEAGIALNSYTEYIFVVVSARSTSSLPEIENINNLDKAKIKEVNADLLYWKSNKMKLNAGQNFLAAKLKPKFSEITTTLKMDQTMTGLITDISNPIFNTVARNVTLNLSDGTISHGTVNTAGKTISFPSLDDGKRIISSYPTTLIHDTKSTGTLNFGSLSVDEETKTNIIIAGLTLKPGHRYNLILTLKTCTEAVNGLNGFNWEFPETTNTTNEGTSKKPNYVTYTGINFKPTGSNTTTFKKNGEMISFQFTEAGADYGFVYDIMELDNAFNLEVNGTPLVGNSVTAGEIQF